MEFWVYIIYWGQLDRYYLGYSVDLEIRLEQHNSGISQYTSKAKDWVLNIKEELKTREEAVPGSPQL